MKYSNQLLKQIALVYPDHSHFVHFTLKGGKEVTLVVHKNSDLIDAVEDNIKNLIAVHGYKSKDIKTQTFELPEVRT